MASKLFDDSDVFETAEWVRSGTYVLKQIDLFNWGAFNGRHCAQIDPFGSAIIGPTGSGKTTVVDALMTLITSQPRYNFASTGGHESDRDLISYIRGVTGAGNATGDGRHISRQGKTTTGVSAIFQNDQHHVEVAGIFWLDTNNATNADRKDLWIYSERDDQSLDDWLTLHHEGGARELKQHIRDTTHIKVFDTKKAYLSQLRRCFEVGENAFTLLNRAAGLKQINSIDEIFRELVLEDHSVFDRAREVANEFDDLNAIHSELVVAKKQQQSLIPIVKANQKFQETITQREQTRALTTMLPIWIGQLGSTLWQQQVEQLFDKLEQVNHKVEGNSNILEQQEQQTDIAYQKYLQCGGSSLEQLKEQIDDKTKQLDKCRKQANEYSQVMRSMQRDDRLDPDSFSTNVNWAREQLENLSRQVEQATDQLYQIGATKSRDMEVVRELTTEITAIRQRPDSNIPFKYQQFRAELAAALTIEEQSLPFIAELVEIKQAHSAWRGAIERALGGNRLRILTPPETLQKALSWINHRDNKLHVRLLNAREPEHPVKFHVDGFAHKLTFKAHPCREAMKSLLAEVDRHCVDSVDDLASTPHGLTQQGMMSGKAKHFDKHDQQQLDRGWLTGFSNKDQLSSLTTSLDQASLAYKQSQQQHEDARHQLQSHDNTIKLLNSLIEQEFESIDVQSLEKNIGILQQRLAAISDPVSDIGKTQSVFENAKSTLNQIKLKREQLVIERTRHESELNQAKQALELSKQRISASLDESQQALCAKHLVSSDSIKLEHLSETEQALTRSLQDQTERLNQKQSRLSNELIRLMEAAKRVDTGALAEVNTQQQDITAYLERLRVLEEEALPEKQERFLAYLNQSSDQGVTQLLFDVDNEVRSIEDRIEELNLTLKKVNFQDNRYLQLAPRKVTHESLRTLQRAQAALRSAELNDDKGEGQFHALENIVNLVRDASEKKRTVAARALLDPRYRLQFLVSVLDRASGELIESRSGSQGGSGGEKEIIASYILTASLSYALCPDGSNQPLFGTIILDEAFSKSSHAVASRIISALKEFGLHSIFVTPNKEMRLLREHTRSALLVHMGSHGASLTSLSWQELEAQAQQRLQ